MEIYYLLNSTMKALAERFFIPSIPKVFQKRELFINTVTTGEYGRDGYYDVLVERTKAILRAIECRLDGGLMIWSDVDVLIKRLEPEEISFLMENKDVLFQKEHAGSGNECNAGIQIIRRNTRSLVFYGRLMLLMRMSAQPNDQKCVNELLPLMGDISWGHLPRTYSSESNRGFSADSRLYHANNTVVNSLQSKWKLLSNAEDRWRT